METFSRRPARFVKASPKCRKRVAGFVDDMLPDHFPSGNQKRFWRDLLHFAVAVGEGVGAGVGKGVAMGRVRCPSANGITHKASSKSRKSALRIRYVLMVGSTRFTTPHFSTFIRLSRAGFADDTGAMPGLAVNASTRYRQPQKRAGLFPS